MRYTPNHDLSATTWIKSSYSQGGGNCLEVTAAHPTLIPVRDSKNPLGPKLVFRSAAWSAFVADVKGNAR